jgi:hypothetical protein
MLDRSQLALAVGHADVAAFLGHGFHSSAGFFHTGELDRRYWKDVSTLDKVIAPLTLDDHTFLVVEGDVLADVKMSDSCTVVVHGHVRSSIQTGGHCELVVAGNVLEKASISSKGIFHLFVGGDFSGELRSHSSCTMWVQEDLHGWVWTGTPSTHLHVLGDCTARIRPSERPALLCLSIGGFMAYASLEATAAVGYTEFNASVGKSDRPAGMYPEKTVYQAFQQHRSYNRWVIRDGAGQGGSQTNGAI